MIIRSVKWVFKRITMVACIFQRSLQVKRGKRHMTTPIRNDAELDPDERIVPHRCMKPEFFGPEELLRYKSSVSMPPINMEIDYSRVASLLPSCCDHVIDCPRIVGVVKGR